MIVMIRRLGMFVVGGLVGALFGFGAFSAQDDEWYRYDWRKFVLPPALLAGLLSATLGNKAIQGTWSSIAFGGFAGGVVVPIVSLVICKLVVRLGDLEWEFGNNVEFFAVYAGLPLGMLIGGLLGGRLGKKHQET